MVKKESKSLFGSSKPKPEAPKPQNDRAQDRLENQLREDTLRLQQFEQRKAERILFDM